MTRDELREMLVDELIRSGRQPLSLTEKEFPQTFVHLSKRRAERMADDILTLLPSALPVQANSTRLEALEAVAEAAMRVDQADLSDREDALTDLSFAIAALEEKK